jgi:hypothetical protein
MIVPRRTHDLLLVNRGSNEFFTKVLILPGKKRKVRWGGDLNSCGHEGPIALEAIALPGFATPANIRIAGNL